MANLEEPKKAQTAYFMWLSENRPALQKEAGSNNVGIVGKFAGEQWNKMEDAKKKPYQDRAAEAKKAYEKELEEYKSKGGVVGQRRQEKKEAKMDKDDKRVKKARDKASGKPKRPQTSYFLWLNENREALQKEAGTKDLGKVGKLAGEKWKKLPDADKAPYEKKAKEEKAAYEKAFVEWKASNPEGKDEGEEEDDSKEDETPKDEPPAKKARTEASPKAKGKAKGKAKAKEGKQEEVIDPKVLKMAQDKNLESQLMNLAKRDEIKAKGHTAEKMLGALQQCGGLVNKAKQILMAGA